MAIEPDVRDQRMDSDMNDYGGPGGGDFEPRAHDSVPVRSMQPGDLAAVVRIDKKLVGRERRDFFEAKLAEMMRGGGVRVSLIAEADGNPVGYIMARVDYGEFGHTEQAAVIDIIGVDPNHGHHGVGAALLSQLLVNLQALHVECVRTSVQWDNFPVLGFLAANGFKPSQQLLLAKTILAD